MEVSFWFFGLCLFAHISITSPKKGRFSGSLFRKNVTFFEQLLILSGDSGHCIQLPCAAACKCDLAMMSLQHCNMEKDVVLFQSLEKDVVDTQKNNV